MYYACVNHLHTTQIVIIMKGCLQQPLPRNLFSDVWHMVRHVRTQRIDAECIVQPNRTCNSVTFGRHAPRKNKKQTCVVYYIAYSTVQNILHTLFFLYTIYALYRIPKTYAMHTTYYIVYNICTIYICTYSCEREIIWRKFGRISKTHCPRKLA